MTNPAVKAETDQQEELTLSGYGFKMIINGHDKPQIFDDKGEAITDINAYMAAQQKLLLSLVKNLGPSWQQDIANLEAAKKTVGSMSASVAAAFANDNNVDVTKVGYVTKASEGLPFRVQYAGLVKDDKGGIYRDENGDVRHLYTTVDPVLKNDSHYKAATAFRKINKQGEYGAAGFGGADFPTSKYGPRGQVTGTDMLQTLFKNKKALGIKADWIHGEARDNDSSYFLYSRNGELDVDNKDATAVAFPTWVVKHPII
jgi:hypothetical protein